MALLCIPPRLRWWPRRRRDQPLPLPCIIIHSFFCRLLGSSIALCSILYLRWADEQLKAQDDARQRQESSRVGAMCLGRHLQSFMPEGCSANHGQITS